MITNKNGIMIMTADEYDAFCTLCGIFECDPDYVMMEMNIHIDDGIFEEVIKYGDGRNV